MDGNYDRQLIGLSASGVPESLPIVHITASWMVKDIVRVGTLQTKPCKVFKKELLYFFVLRPAYCLKSGDERAEYIDYFPAALVLRPEAVKHPYHVYPFDTGAGIGGAFGDRPNRHIPLDDYALDPSHEAAAGFIGWAFGSLERYFEGRLRADLEDELKPTHSVANSYVAIARMGVDGHPEHDKRASAVELASAGNVDLSDNSQLIIMPKPYLEDARLAPYIRKLRKLGVKFKSYDWQSNRSPNEFQKDLMSICRKWFRSKGIYHG